MRGVCAAPFGAPRGRTGAPFTPALAQSSAAEAVRNLQRLARVAVLEIEAQSCELKRREAGARVAVP